MKKHNTAKQTAPKHSNKPATKKEAKAVKNSKKNTRRNKTTKESWAKCKTRVEAAKKIKAEGITLAGNAAKKHLVEIMDARRTFARVYGVQLLAKDRKKLHKQPGQVKKIASAKKTLASLCTKYGYSSVREAWDTAKAFGLFEKQQ